MNVDEKDDLTVYKVVVNHEEQYSIWPAHRVNPPGWTEVEKKGDKAECLSYIKEVWTDMRPLSLRKKMEEAERTRRERGAQPQLEVPEDVGPRTPNDLVRRLSDGEHKIEITLRPERNLKAFRDCIDRGYVHIKFTETRGGTELGVRLDPQACDFSGADFEAASGRARLVGGLTLDYVKVRCVADVDLRELSGRGHLEPVESEVVTPA